MFKKIIEVFKTRKLWIESSIDYIKKNPDEAKQEAFKIISKWARKKKRRIVRVFEEPRRLLRLIFFLIILIKLRATPSNVKYFFKWYLWLGTATFYRSSINLFGNLIWTHKSVLFYIAMNFFICLLIKIYQEVYFNFDCPVAVLLYGIFFKRYRPLLEKAREKAEKSRLRKEAIKNRKGGTRADRLKALAEREKMLEEIKPSVLKVMDAQRKEYKIAWIKWRRKWPELALYWAKKRFKKRLCLT